jgi:hypothetical protein
MTILKVKKSHKANLNTYYITHFAMNNIIRVFRIWDGKDLVNSKLSNKEALQ